MTINTHSARVTRSLPFATPDGEKGTIPPGPCLIEQIDARLVDIIWGAQGQSSALLPVEVVEAAAQSGQLELLD